MLETVHTAVTALRNHGMFREVVVANIARSYSIGTGIMFKPLDPVYIVCGGYDPC
jgi:cobalt-precorrin-6B (C15)-methyltransferase